MNIIDTFLYVFKSDDKGLIEGQLKAEKTVQKTTESLDRQRVGAEKLAAGIQGLAGSLVGAVAAFASLGAIKSAVLQAAEHTAALDKQARALRMSVDDLSVWQGAVVRAGGTTGGLEATLKMLSERTRDPLLALERVADRFKGLTDRRADRLGQALGIDAGLVEMMRNGREGLRQHIELQYKLGQVTQEQVEASRKWRMAQADLNVMQEDVRRRLMVAVLPAFTKITEVMQKVIFWTRENSRFLSMIVPSAALVALLALAANIGKVAAAFKLLTFAMMTNPLVAFIAICIAVGAAIALVVDDLLAWREGANSLFGDLLKTQPWLKAWGEFVLGIFDEITGGFKSLVQFFSKAGSELKEILGPVFKWLTEKFEGVGKAIDTLKIAIPGLGPVLRALTAVGVIGNAAPTPTNPAKALQDFSKNPAAAQSKAATEYGQATAKGTARSDVAAIMQDWVTNIAPKGAPTAALPVPEVKVIIDAGKLNVGAAQSNPLTSMTSTSINNRNSSTSKVTNVTTGPITVNTQASDPEAVSKAIGNSLANQIKQANNEFDNGVLA